MTLHKDTPTRRARERSRERLVKEYFDEAHALWNDPALADDEPQSLPMMLNRGVEDYRDIYQQAVFLKPPPYKRATVVFSDEFDCESRRTTFKYMLISQVIKTDDRGKRFIDALVVASVSRSGRSIGYCIDVDLRDFDF